MSHAMKIGMVGFTFALSAIAGTLSLKPGNEATIKANDETKVVCEKSAPDYREVLIPRGTFYYSFSTDCERVKRVTSLYGEPYSSQVWKFQGFKQCGATKYVIATGRDSRYTETYLFPVSDVQLF